MNKLIVCILFLLIPSISLAQDDLSFYEKHAKHIEANDFEYYGVDYTNKEQSLTELAKQCESYYGQIQIFIKVKKYEHNVVNKHPFSDSKEVKQLRLLRNKVCKKHIKLLEEIYSINQLDESKQRLEYWKHRYIVFLK